MYVQDSQAESNMVNGASKEVNLTVVSLLDCENQQTESKNKTRGAIMVIQAGGKLDPQNGTRNDPGFFKANDIDVPLFRAFVIQHNPGTQ